MKLLGLDIGTTTVSAAVVENNTVIDSLTMESKAFIASCRPWEKIQDPEKIRKTAFAAVEKMLGRYSDIGKIGITGQMHGIVYLDAAGVPVSPLYTWQDRRGELNIDGKPCISVIEELTGYKPAAGYGIATHFYNLKTGLVPKTASVFCTIHDYIAMLLAGNTVPLTDVSDAASLGLFDVRAAQFDGMALKKAGIGIENVPHIAEKPCIGSYKEKIPVYVGIGDNQASFIGAVDGRLDSMLINVGTGSQFSVYSREYLSCPGLETRPFPAGGYLIVGASLCGGRAYALLESFFRDAVGYMTGKKPESCYDAMQRMLDGEGRPLDLPEFLPIFQGTRLQPERRGVIRGLSTENFTPLHLTWAMLEGMANELNEMYSSYLGAGGKAMRLVGAGNGLRKNIYLQNMVSQAFGQQLEMSDCVEEAAVGAAKFAQSCN